MSHATKPVFIIGYGDPGGRVRKRWMEQGAKVRALVRRPVRLGMQMAAILNAPMMRYLGESRRIDNTRGLNTLGWSLRYPDLASGLAAVR